MISIHESNLHIPTIAKTHITFVAAQVKKHIEFYLDTFNALPDLQKRKVTAQEVIDRLMGIKRTYDLKHYKRLLKFCLKGSLAVKNDNGLVKLKNKKNLVAQAKDYHTVTNLLTQLLIDYQNILSFEINGNQPAKITQYTTWKTRYEPIKFLLNGIFDYEEWFLTLDTKEPWGPYQLAIALNIRSCPYCNRSYTFSLTNGSGAKKGRPDFDHFLPKHSNPLLSLSFFNLIPSCKACNGPAIKGALPIGYNSHLNPYEDNAKNSLMRFTYFPNTYEASIGLDENVDIFLKYAGDSTDFYLKKKVEGNIDLFYLEETYKFHTDIVQGIIRRRTIDNDRSIEQIQKAYKHLSLTTAEAYQIAFGSYYFEKDFHKRPIAKLTKDIAIEIKTLIKVKKAKK